MTAIIDHMMMDGLEDAYETGRSMGDFGEATAEAYQFTRADQDAYAMETLTRARKAVEGGAFKAEIAPITADGEGRPARSSPMTSIRSRSIPPRSRR